MFLLISIKSVPFYWSCLSVTRQPCHFTRESSLFFYEGAGHKTNRVSLDSSFICIQVTISCCTQRFKPWPNGLESFRLAFRLAAHVLTGLRWFWSSSNSCASRRKPFTVWSPNTSWSHVDCIYVKFTTCVKLRVDLRVRLATHRKVRTQVLVLQTCVDLRVRLATHRKVRTQVLVLQTCVDLRVRLARALNFSLRSYVCELVRIS